MTSYLVFLVMNLVALKRAVLSSSTSESSTLRRPSLLGRGVLGDGLGALRNGVFGQLSGQKETNGSLDFATGDRGSFVVLSKA